MKKSEINEIANMAFITGRTNRRISNKLPTEYFPGIVRRRGEEALRDQRIPMDTKLWEIDNYRSFLEGRRKALADLLNRFIDSAYASGSVGLLDTDED